MKAQFYKITCNDEQDDSLDACVEAIEQSFFQADGNYEDCDGVGYRIEKFERTSDYCTWDFVRRQTEDIPPLAATGKPLKAGKTPLGHQTAFLYQFSTQVLLVQSNKNGVSAAMALKFVRHKLSHKGFDCMPILDQGTWDDLLNGVIRKVKIKFAAPENLAVAESGGSDLDNLNRMRSLFGGPSMEISVGFDTPKPGALNNVEVVKFVKSLWTSSMKPQKIQAYEGGELLDLLGKKHSYEEKNLILNSSDVDTHYKERKNFLQRALADSEAFIEEFFKQAA